MGSEFLMSRGTVICEFGGERIAYADLGCFERGVGGRAPCLRHVEILVGDVRVQCSKQRY